MLFLSYLVKNSMDRVSVICKWAMKRYLLRMCSSCVSNTATALIWLDFCSPFVTGLTGVPLYDGHTIKRCCTLHLQLGVGYLVTFRWRVSTGGHPPPPREDSFPFFWPKMFKLDIPCYIAGEINCIGQELKEMFLFNIFPRVNLTWLK